MKSSGFGPPIPNKPFDSKLTCIGNTVDKTYRTYNVQFRRLTVLSCAVRSPPHRSSHATGRASRPQNAPHRSRSSALATEIPLSSDQAVASSLLPVDQKSLELRAREREAIDSPYISSSSPLRDHPSKEALDQWERSVTSDVVPVSSIEHSEGATLENEQQGRPSNGRLRREMASSRQVQKEAACVEVRSSRRPRTRKARRSKPIGKGVSRVRPAASIQPSASASQGRQGPERTDVETELQQDAEFLETIKKYLDKTRMKTKSGKDRRMPQQDLFADSVSYFLSSIANTPLLKAKQEQALGRIIVRGLSVRKAGEELARTCGSRPDMEKVAVAAGLPSADAAARAIMLGDEAKELMVIFNLRMVFNIARKAYRSLSSCDVELSDLISEGTIGLRRAINSWDPYRKLKFSTYGHWWIRQSVYRYVSKHRMAVRLPYMLEELNWKIKKTIDKLSLESDRTEPPTTTEIASELGVPVEKITLVLKHNRPLIGGSGVAPDLSGNDQTNFGTAEDILIDESDPLGEAEREEHVKTLLSLLLCMLPTRERNVLRLRYNLSAEVVRESSFYENALSDSESNDFQPRHDLQAVGSAYSLCRERIRQLERIALARLRVPWRQALARMLQSGTPLTNDKIETLVATLNGLKDGSERYIDRAELSMLLSSAARPRLQDVKLDYENESTNDIE